MTAQLAETDGDFQLHDLKLEIDIEENQFVYNKFQITDGVIEILSVEPPGKIKFEEELDLSRISTKDINSCDIENLPEIFLPSITSQVPQRTTKAGKANIIQSRKRTQKLHKPPEITQQSAKDKSPTERNKCQLCAKCFQSAFHLRRHLQSMIHATSDINHNVTKPTLARGLFKCQICEKAFHTQQHLSQHFVRHATTRDFRCHHCSAAFKVKADLVKHMIMHFDLIAQSKCQTCDKSFKSPIRLRRHVASHNNVRNFKCAHCPSTHKRKADLKKHLAVHFEDLKKYLCTRCSKKLLGWGDLKFHLRTASCGRNKGLKQKK